MTDDPHIGVFRRAAALRRWQAAETKNLAIANRSRVSCAYNTLRASIGINITP